MSERSSTACFYVPCSAGCQRRMRVKLRIAKVTPIAVAEF